MKMAKVFKGEEVLIEKVEVANTFKKRLFGLLFSPCPRENEGLMFENCNAIHCFFMRYSIGVLFLDKEGFLKKKLNRVRPWTLAMCKNAWYTIEINSSFCQSLNVTLGDKLEINIR